MPSSTAVPEKVGEQQVTPLVVVDGGSDRTAEVSFAAQALTCVLPVNLGQGAALRIGYGLASDLGARYVVTLDADGQNDPAELGVMLEPLLDGAADFVIASTPTRPGPDHRPIPAGGSTALRGAPQHHRRPAAHRLLERLPIVSNRAPRRHRPPLAPGPVPDGRSGHRRLDRGWRITEAPTVWHPRASGASKKGGNLVFGLHYAEVILTTWRRMARGKPARPALAAETGRSVATGRGDRAVVELLDGGSELFGGRMDRAAGHPTARRACAGATIGSPTTRWMWCGRGSRLPWASPRPTRRSRAARSGPRSAPRGTRPLRAGPPRPDPSGGSPRGTAPAPRPLRGPTVRVGAPPDRPSSRWTGKPPSFGMSLARNRFSQRVSFVM